MRDREPGLEQGMEKSESNRETSTRGETRRRRPPVPSLASQTPEIITQKVCAHVSICGSVRDIGLKRRLSMGRVHVLNPQLGNLSLLNLPVLKISVCVILGFCSYPTPHPD